MVVGLPSVGFGLGLLRLEGLGSIGFGAYPESPTTSSRVTRQVLSELVGSRMVLAAATPVAAQ